MVEGGGGGDGGGGSRNVGGQEAEVCGPPPPPSSSDSPESLICMSLYLHRVKGLVLALLVDPDFLNNKASMEEVVRNFCHFCRG